MDQVKRTSTRAWAVALCLLAVAAFGQAPAKSILVLRPAGASFDDAVKGMKETLGPGFALKEFVVSKETPVDEVVKSWKTAEPKAVVAMDNKGVNLFRDARLKLGDSTVPVIALMGVRIDASLKGVANAVGVNYEIPAVTILVNLRSILPTPVKKTGVIYRASMEDMFMRNVEFCKQENIELVGLKVEDAADAKEGLDKALKDVLGRSDIDALWVVNDNFFLNAKLIKEVWLPKLAGWKHPVIVGVETLVKPEYKFGTFAVLPDNYALGTQAAGLLQEIDDAGWKVEETKVDQPLSVIKTLNLRGMKQCCGIQEGKLGEVDKVLE